MVREELNIPSSDKLKKNGTFSRGIYYIANDILQYRRVKIQTMLWTKSNGKKTYISIFPSCIIKYNKVSCDLIEFISNNVGKGESVFKYIEDAENLIECEDILIRSCQRVNMACSNKKFSSLLNARYTAIFNTSINISGCRHKSFKTYLFSSISILLQTANICCESSILKASSLSSLNKLFKFLR